MGGAPWRSLKPAMVWGLPPSENFEVSLVQACDRVPLAARHHQRNRDLFNVGVCLSLFLNSKTSTRTTPDFGLDGGDDII